MTHREKQLISYIPIGLKSESFNIDLISSMKENGSDMFELGLPFSDPVADGVVIQKANMQSLKQGYKINESFSLAEKIQKLNIDFVFMGYFNTFFKQGIENFITHFSKGCIIPDLPYEEAQKYTPLFDKYKKSIIPLLAPTTPIKRIKQLIKDANVFIYLVAYLGVTGNTSSKSEDLSHIINEVRKHSNTPIYIGFGVTPDNADIKVKNTDGVIVASCYVSVLLDTSLSDSQKIKKISQISQNIKYKINS